MTTEALLITALEGAIKDVPIHGDVPTDRPPKFITVERLGGPRDLIQDRGTYALQCWAPTRAKAAALSEQVADAVLHLPATTPALAATDVVSALNFPDPDSGQARYQVTVNAVAMTTI